MYTYTRYVCIPNEHSLASGVGAAVVTQHANADQVIYEWEQSLEELNVYIRPPPGITASMILCEIAANHVTLGLRGSNDKFLNVRTLCQSLLLAARVFE